MTRRTTRSARGATTTPAPVLVLAIIAALFFVVPFLGLLLRAPWSDLTEAATSPEVTAAMRLSLVCSLWAVALSMLFGLPLAWLLARVAFPGRSVLRGLVTLPVVLPPVVGGVALLLALGRLGLVGRWLESAFGITLFGSVAAVVIAETFVAMPFFVISVEAALRSMDRRYEDAAHTLGASSWTVFRRVTIPLISRAIGAGGLLAWARALGEFGATITFAGNLPERTQTIPLAVYIELQSQVEGAIALSILLVGVSLIILVVLRDRWWSAL